MASTHGIKCRISELHRARFGFEVNPFRFSGESKMIHLGWRNDGWGWAGEGAHSHWHMNHLRSAPWSGVLGRFLATCFSAELTA